MQSKSPLFLSPFIARTARRFKRGSVAPKRLAAHAASLLAESKRSSGIAFFI